MRSKNNSFQKHILLCLLLTCFHAGLAHQPDLSSLMIYEQNGESILLIKSALTAFEGQINYHYSKGSYKTPEEFKKLVINHFQKNCFVIINGDSIKLTNIHLALGHETTLFAELSNKPTTVESLYLKNTIFKDTPNSLCEVILIINNLPQKQFILESSQNYEAKLNIENKKWIVDDKSYEGVIFMVFCALLIVILIILGTKIKMTKSLSFINRLK